MSKFGLFVVIALLIGGCASAPATQSAESLRVLQCMQGWSCVSRPEDAPPSSTESGRTQTNPTLQPATSSAPASQPVLISDIQGNVSVQETPGRSYIPVQSGEEIPSGVSIRTDGSGRARLRVQSDGTTVNIGYNTSFAVTSISSSADGKSEMRISLEAGELWALPRGQVAIETEMGTASSDGSPLGVRYDPSTSNLEASCLEGICSLKNNEGEIILTPGMKAAINNGHLPYSSEQMSGDALQEWVNENSNLKNYFGSNFPGWLPDPSGG